MRLLLTAAVAAASLAACSPSTAAPPAAAAGIQPRTFETVPIYPGLTKTGEEPTIEGGEVLMNDNETIPFVSGTKRSYTVAATPEEVHNFYLSKLGGKIGYSSEDTHEFVKPNGSTPVILSLHEYDFEDRENISGPTLRGATKKATLTAARKPLADGKWVSESQFQWTIRDAKGDLRSFHVSIQDEGLAKNWSGYAPKTLVEITVNQFKH